MGAVATPAAGVEIVASDTEDQATIRALIGGLVAFNTAAAGPHGWRPLTLMVRRPGDVRPAGGLMGFSDFGWLFVKLFWLPEDLRRSGLGTELLRRAEAEARARGCVGVWLDTFSFQARPFYEKRGYRVFGTTEDHPPGHRRFFLMKRLDDGAGGTADVPA